MVRVLPEEIACGRARRGHGRIVPEDLLCDAPAPSSLKMEKGISGAACRVYPEGLVVTEDDPQLIFVKKPVDPLHYDELRRFGRKRQTIEKVWLLIDRIQCFGVVWLCSQAWPWPTIWLEWTRWAACSNVDVAVFGKKGAGIGATGGGLGRSVYGETRGYLVKVALPVVAAAAVSLVMLQRGKWTFVRLASFLYAPCGIVLARLFQCEYLPASARGGGLRLSVDPTHTCFGRAPFFARIVLAPTIVILSVLLPRKIWARVEDACEYEADEDHEYAVEAAEIEHALKIDDCDDYEIGNVWIFSSYRQWATCRDARIMVKKLLLIACFGCLSKLSRSQGAAIFSITLIFAIPDLARPPFRQTSTNFLFYVTEIAAIATSAYAMLTSWGLRSATVMPKQQSLALFAINGTAGVLSLFSFLWLQECRAAVTVRKATERHGPEVVREWISSSKRARIAAGRCRAWRPVETAPIGDVERLMAEVRDHWMVAKQNDRTFEIILRRSLDELVLAHQATAPGVLQRRRFGEERGWLSEDAEFDGDAVRARYESQSLLRPSKRVLLMKLLALRANK